MCRNVFINDTIESEQTLVTPNEAISRFQTGESKDVSSVTKQETILKFLSLYSLRLNLISQSYQNENWKTGKIYGFHSRSKINDPVL